ncbi:DNA cytosine methyltransferase [Staphylococcus hyicus]|uniref:DNA cytosine methyltransferase n=1 Tax=Staphylococcus hyicus TaxID=1284 RepID=A0ACD5FMX0_STAHY|nr:DNA (cytosine-5-)-methyltransferase [Staphylococcus hyicus]MDP4462570.1 DNA (cytosine-5-)-methyltransferase [Staphylococcus hyicus]
MKKVKMLSLFSGIGAPETAIKNLGYDLEVLNYCEIDKYASTSYQAIHNEDKSKNLLDVRDVDGTMFKDIDLLFHGSPCQSFSTVGKQEGGDKDSGTKSSLMWETVRIVNECRPKIVIWENVKGVLNKKHKHNFDTYIKELEDIGYKSTYKVISPRDIGEAQSRPRVFVVSTIKGQFEFPNIVKSYQKCISDYMETIVDPKYILPKNIAETLAYGNPNFCGRMTILRHTDLAGCLVAKSGRAARTTNFLLYQHEDYSKMSNAKDIRFLLQNNVPIRSLTPLEYWRLQGFNDEQFYIARKALADTYKNGNLSLTDAQLYKQAGNSINVKVLESFIDKVLKTLY